ncbi:MAG TPA: hypothetical protein VGB85_14380 [Nannocystis sp.]
MGRVRSLWVWAGATWVALTIVMRVARGEVVVLSAHAAPVVRLVATLLVFLAGCAEKLQPQGSAEDAPKDMSQRPAVPAPAPVFELPAGLDDAGLERARAWAGRRVLWSQFSGEVAPDVAPPEHAAPDPAITGAVEAFVAAAAGHVARARSNVPETAASLTALLDAAEAFHLYDAWLAAHLWAHTRALRPAPGPLYARIDRHLRVCDAISQAEFTTGPIEFSAWRSKAGPPPGWRPEVRVPAGLVAAARAGFARATAGSFESDHVLTLTVARGEVVWIHGGAEQRVPAGSSLRLRRIDLVRAPSGAALRHDKLGELVLRPGAELVAWTVGDFVAPAKRAALRGAVERALAGDGAALDEVEATLPAIHDEVRAAIAGQPGAPGAAGLRLVLENFAG